MPKARPVIDEEREQVRVLHEQGWSRNAIAKHLRRSGRMVSNVAKDLGLTFDRAAMTAVATETRAMDLAARRLQLAQDLHEDAERMRRQLWEPTTVWNFGGAENSYEERTFPEAPADVKRTIMGAVGTAVDRSLKLAPPTDQAGNEEGIAMMSKLMSGLAAVYLAQQGHGQEADEGA